MIIIIALLSVSFCIKQKFSWTMLQYPVVVDCKIVSHSFNLTICYIPIEKDFYTHRDKSFTHWILANFNSGSQRKLKSWDYILKIYVQCVAMCCNVQTEIVKRILSKVCSIIKPKNHHLFCHPYLYSYHYSHLLKDSSMTSLHPSINTTPNRRILCQIQGFWAKWRKDFDFMKYYEIKLYVTQTEKLSPI